MEFRILGTVDAVDGGRALDPGTPRQRCVLAALALSPGHPVAVDTLVDCVWGEQPPRQARNTLYSYVTRLRRALGQPIRRRSGGYALDVASDQVDLFRFRDLRRRARDADDALAVQLLRDALALWRSSPLCGLPGAWAERVRAGLAGERLAALASYADAALRLGQNADLVTELEAELLEHPTAEPLAAALMRALDCAGRQAEAIEVYARTRQRIVDELGTEPGDQLQSLHLDLLRRRPAQTPNRGVARHLPARTADLTGRVAEQRWLDDLVTAGGRAGAINGMAGVGKTALALDAAYRHAARYPDAQLHVDLHGHTPGQDPLDPASALDTLLRRLGVAAERIPADADERAALWRAELAGRRCVVVLDNASSAAQVRPLLTDAPGSLVLVTSRRRLVGLAGVRSLSLDVLPPDDAAALLADAAGADRISGDTAALTEVARLCGHLPLALRIAGARLQHRPTWTVRHLLTRLDDERRRLAELTAEDLSVASSFGLSYQHLGDEQRRAFRLLGLVPCASLDVYAAAAVIGVEPATAERVLDDLVEAHLLEEPAPGRYRFHDLLRDLACRTAQDDEPAPARRDALRRLLDFYLAAADAASSLLISRPLPGVPQLAAPPTALPMIRTWDEAMSWLETERQNLIAAVRLAERHAWPTCTWQLAARLRQFFYLRGYLADWLETHRLGLSAALELADPVAEGLIRTYLGICCRLAGLFDEAFEHLGRALSLHRASGDRDREASTLNGLGITYGITGRYPQAMAAYRDVARIWGETGHTAGEAHGHNNLGELLIRLRRPLEAIAELKVALRLARETDDRHIGADPLRNLGEAYSLVGRAADALDCCRQALLVVRAAGGRRAEVTVLNSIGVVQRRAGRAAEAIAAHEQALDLAACVGTDVEKAEILNDLGLSLRAIGRRENALTSHRQALTLARRLQDPYEEARALDGIGHALPPDAADKAARYRRDAATLFSSLGVPRADDPYVLPAAHEP